MKTIYIDVYFLINLTVDMLAVFLSLRFMHLHISNKRWFLTGLISAILAIIYLLSGDDIFQKLLCIILLNCTILFLTVRNGSLICRLKLLLLFYVFTFLIGGAVNFLYSFLSDLILDLEIKSEAVWNNKVIVFSMIILLLIGAFRIMINVFSASMNPRNIRLRIQIGDKSLETDAFVDSGNLVKDPMNMQPVIFIKKVVASKFLPKEAMEISNVTKLNEGLLKRIRIIPVTRNGETHVMTGIRVDNIALIKENGRNVEFDATIVIDKEEGTFGGCEALIPYVPFYYDL